MICTICGKQPIRLKRHIQQIHKKEGKELETLYNEAKYKFKGISYKECSICGRGLRHMRLHLTRTHKLDPSTPEYRLALGNQSEYSRPVSKERLSKIRSRRCHMNAHVPVSVFEWIRYETRAGASVDGTGMRRNVRSVLEILKQNSLNFMSLVTPNSIDKTYKIIYEELVKKYKHLSISVILGHVKRFVDWACSEADYVISPRVRREHELYTKLCRRKGGRENFDRKIEEYLPTLRDIGPLIHSVKHRYIINGLLERPSETIENESIDLIHATIAWPCILKSGVRTGVLMNMCVNEVLGATKYQEGFIIRVRNHKTSEHYGPYQIGLNEEEYAIIFNFIRNRTWTSDYVFSTRGGKKFSLSNIQRFMRVLFNIYGLRDMRITTIRKFLTSHIHKEGNDNMIEATASLLKHSIKTARRDYKAMQHDRDALKTANNLAHMLKDQLRALNIGLPDESDPSEERVGNIGSIDHVQKQVDVIDEDTQQTHMVIRPEGHLENAEDLVDDHEMEHLILEDDEEFNIEKKHEKLQQMEPEERVLKKEEDREENNNDKGNEMTINPNNRHHCKTKIYVKSPELFLTHCGESSSNSPSLPETINKRKNVGPRRFFLPEHLALIKNTFKFHIQSGLKPTYREVREKKDILKEIYDYGYDTKSIERKMAESVRSQIRLNKGN
nr:MAG: tyrosine recombinase [Penaeus monodon endogenous nimavirus]